MGKGNFGGFSLFGRRGGIYNNGLPRAVAFVDYEHWFISLERLHHLKPNIQAWFDDLKTRCNLVEVIFFGNFSKFKDKETETKRIRSFTNKIIDTFNPDLHYKKDYTDFIILDNIYQKAVLQSDAELFIIFSGDGHFSSAAAFIRNFCHKQVGIYGVQGAISKNLINSADWYREVPLEKEKKDALNHAIFSTFKNNERSMGVPPTFKRAVEIISAENQLESQEISDALCELINEGYINQIPERTKRNMPIKILRTDWKKVAESGIWSMDALKSS